MVTVLITTADRPQMLRTALQSVARQTVAEKIAEVIVSENGGNPASGKVCKEFGKLPITYRFREPPIQRGNYHIMRVLAETKTRWSALLFDDDWWAPQHLEVSLAALQRHPEASACLAGLLFTAGENFPPEMHNNLQFWMGAEFPPYTEEWLLTRSMTAVACLANTPGNYSSIVAETTRFVRANATLPAHNNLYDNDRILFFEFTRDGPLVFLPTPQVFIRRHTGNDNLQFRSEDIHRLFRATTEWILKCCAEESIDVTAELARRLTLCPPPWRPLLGGCFHEVSRQLLRERGIYPKTMIAMEKASRRHARLKSWLPPSLSRRLGW